MKKYLVLILVVGAFILISPFKVSAGEAKEDWKNDLDLSDSISTSVVELDDGVVVMQYEGGASDNNLLIKYDFKGNQLWSIKNNYGYHIASLGDSFLVYTTGHDYSITKISSQGELVWTKEYNSEDSYSVSDSTSFSSSQVIKIDSGFIIFSGYCIGLYDDNGTFIKYITFSDVYYSEFDKEARNISDFSVALSSDGESVLIAFITREFVTPRYVDYYVVARYSLDLNYQESVRYYTPTAYYPLFKMIETENNYILTGRYTLVLDKKGEINRVLDVAMINLEYIDGYVYAYIGKAEEDYGIYSTYLAKYDENLQKIDEYRLPFVFSSISSYKINTATAFIVMKNRSVFYKNGDDVYSVVLNSPMSNVQQGYVLPINDLDYTLNSKYNISQYKLANSGTDSEVTDDGIIDNIFENPETSSTIAVVIAFVIVILIGGLGFYLGYKKKVKAK